MIRTDLKPLDIGHDWAECYACGARADRLWGWGEHAKEGRHCCIAGHPIATPTLMYQWFCERCCKQKGWLW